MDNNSKTLLLRALTEKAEKPAPFSTRQERDAFRQAVLDSRAALAACRPELSYDWMQNELSRLKPCHMNQKEKDAYHVGVLAAKSILSGFRPQKGDAF